MKRSVGISLESARSAELPSMSDLYNESYRVLSRNVHAVDIAVMEITVATLTLQDTSSCRLYWFLTFGNCPVCLGALSICRSGSTDNSIIQMQVR